MGKLLRGLGRMAVMGSLGKSLRTLATDEKD
jgi:hypothetical protein